MAVGVGCLLAGSPSDVSAQAAFELTGPRALGMAGAFVAVASDASASHWNPAGLILGPPVGAVAALDRFQFRNQPDRPVPASSSRTTQFVSVGSWPLGLAWMRYATDVRAGGQGAGSAVPVEVSQFGATVLQSVGEAAVTGATFKYMHSRAPDGRSGAFDLDLGVLVGTDRLRAGLTVKNLLRPGLGVVGDIPRRLPRLVRLGLAASPVDGVTLAMDVDLDTADPLVGLRRMIALGGETRLGSRAALRAGVRWQRGRAGQAIGALGASAQLRGAIWLDGYLTHGPSIRGRGVGIAIRVGP